MIENSNSSGIVRMCDLTFDKSLFENFDTHTVLDRLLCSYNGLPKGVNYMIIGDPGSGKTTIILDLLSNVMKHYPDARILFISAEMNEIDLAVYVQRYPILKTGLERLLCPRVHFKMLILDSETAYIGSANLTGAGIGMKSSNRRNFETGLLTNEASLVRAAMEQFDSVRRGIHCRTCDRKKFCTDPLS